MRQVGGQDAVGRGAGEGEHGGRAALRAIDPRVFGGSLGGGSGERAEVGRVESQGDVILGISAVLIGVASGIGEGAGGNGDHAVGDAVSRGREGRHVGGAAASEVRDGAALGADVGRAEVCGGF